MEGVAARWALHVLYAYTRKSFTEGSDETYLSRSAAGDLLSSHRVSTQRQYESGWRKSQDFVTSTRISYVARSPSRF